MNTDKIYAEAIANEYAHKNTTKVVQLKKLDAKAKRPANIFAYTFGIVSSLVLGVGIGVGLLGILGVSINYPIYKKMLEKGKEKYASDIIRLAKEIAE